MKMIRLLSVLAATLFAATPAMAQQVLGTAEFVPDILKIEGDKIRPPEKTGIYPTRPIDPDPMISTMHPGAEHDDDREEREEHHRREREERSRHDDDHDDDDHSSDARPPIIYDEKEVDSGENDTAHDAEKIKHFGTGKKDAYEATISGSLGLAPPLRVLSQFEDDGSIPLALLSDVVSAPDHISFTGTIGDGPLPGVVSDFDFVRAYLPAGSVFTIHVKTPVPFGDLDPFVTFYTPDGTIIFTQDDGDAYDTLVTLVTNVDLDFLMSVGGYGAFYPVDPFDSTSGSITGNIGSEGTYEFDMLVYPPAGAGDVDYFEIKLKKGDVLGAAVRGGSNPYIQIVNKKEEFEKGVSGFGSFADPASPLPVNGETVIDYIAEKKDKYYVALSGGFGAYEMDLGVYRPEFERNPNRIQLIWLDYNGGPVNKEPWFGFPVITDHTPLRGFMSAWGLPDTDQDVRDFTEQITKQTRDNLKKELEKSKENKKHFGVFVMGNDGTGVPSWIEPFIESGSFNFLGLNVEVSVVEVSGTINEAFINTIGIASTIDPGNFSTQDVALVLLDVLSRPYSGFSADDTFRLNDVVLAPGVDKDEMVAEILGNIIAHEAGHYIGNFHTDGFSVQQSIMDQGPGGLFNLAGIGPSGVFGADDQTDLAFVDDLYAVSEGFVGDENTTVNSAFAFSFFPDDDDDHDDDHDEEDEDHDDD